MYVCMCFVLFALYITATPLNSITVCCLNRRHCLLCGAKWNFVSYVGELRAGIFLAWLRQLDPVFLRRRHRFDARLDHVGFVAHQVALGQVFLPLLQFSPVSIIPPLVHTHPSIYHPRSRMFFSQYFSFPCQYHSTIAPYLSIHLPPTL